MAPGSLTVLCSYGYLRRASIKTGIEPLSSRCLRSSLVMRGTATDVIVVARLRAVNKRRRSVGGGAVERQHTRRGNSLDNARLQHGGAGLARGRRGGRWVGPPPRRAAA